MDRERVGRHTGVVLLANAASMVVGLLATVAVAHYFGSGETVDALFIALSVPAMVGQIILSAALVAIVPLYVQFRSQTDIAGAQSRLAPVFYGSALILLGITIAVAVAAPLLIRVLAPGFAAPTVAEAAHLLRLLSPLILILGLTGILQGIENSNHMFARPAWAKPLSAAVALGLLVAAATRLGIASYIWGMLIGSALGLAWQFSEVWSAGGFAPRLAGGHALFRDLKTGLAAIFTARLLGQAGVVITGMVASTLAVGAISSLGYAYRIVSIPFLAASSLGVVIFPALARAAAEGDGEREIELLWRSVRVMTLLGLISSIGLFLWAEPIFQLLFERGAFTAAATSSGATALRVYALGIAFVAANTCIGNAFWAKRWYGVRLRIELIARLLMVGLALTLGRIWGVGGLAGASVAEFVYLTVAGVHEIKKRTPTMTLHLQVREMIRLGLLAVVVTAALWPVVPDLSAFRQWSLVSRGLILIGGLSLATFTFLAAGFLLAIPEIDEAVARILGRLTARGRMLDSEQLTLLPGRVRARLRREILLRVPRRNPKPTRHEQIGEVLGTEAAKLIAAGFRSGPRPPGLYDGTAPDLSAVELDLAVERALRREVDLLGSGPTDLGRPIQWHRDYVSGFVWPAVHHSRVVPVDLSRGADCKFPWEVARCQHWTHLACAREHRNRAIQEMKSQFKEFVLANAPGSGINYGNAMEVAIRSVNWLCAFRAGAAELEDHDVEHLVVEMAAAGQFIRNHLECTGRGLNTNHYIADLLGLYVIGTLVPALPQASEWRQFSGDELTTELTHQFDPEGAHREGSPYYARLVLEFYLFAYVLGQRTADGRVEPWREALEAACSFLAAVMYPDGTLPRIGDDDAGRLLVPPGEPVMDVRYLLQIGAVLFERGDWKERAGEIPRPGLEFWLGGSGVERYRRLKSVPGSAKFRIFESAGLAVTRDEGTVLIVQGGRRDLRMPRGHLHNDLTGIEYFADGIRWVLDPGTYQYTRESIWRNRFRSVSAHNVLQVDDGEQNMLRPDWLFYLCREVAPEPVTRDGEWVVTGYRSLRTVMPKSITRRVRSSAAGRVVQVKDRILGRGEHRLTLGLNLQRTPFTFLGKHLLHFECHKGQLLVYFSLPDGFALTVKDGWHSPRFGVRERCFRLEATGTVLLPVEFDWGLAAVPNDQDVAMWLEQLRCEYSTERVGRAFPEEIDA